MSPTAFYPLEALPSALPPLAVALGVFDGVHRGHQALLAACRAEAAAAPDSGVVTAALTFHPHPAAVFAPTRVPPLLTTVPQRIRLLHAYGAQIVIVATFDRAFAAHTPEEFVRDILVKRLRARAVVVGEDFRYGCNREGDIPSLRAAGERYGFAVRVIAPLLEGGVPVRSTVIRGMIAGGVVEEAARLLGRPYTLVGTVVEGRRLGRTLGFPTANVETPREALVPGAGVYAGRVQVEGAWHRAAISVGTNPTVAENAARTVEAYLLDEFSKAIYGAEITVEFGVYLRGMEKFDDLDALKAQMARDVEETARRIPRPVWSPEKDETAH